MNLLNKLYNDHRLILIAAIVAILLSYVLVQLPHLVVTTAFWEFCLTVSVMALIVLIGQFYYYSRKVIRKKLSA